MSESPSASRTKLRQVLIWGAVALVIGGAFLAWQRLKPHHAPTSRCPLRSRPSGAGPVANKSRCPVLFTHDLSALQHKVLGGGEGARAPRSGAQFLTGLSRHKRLCFWPALSPARAQRVAVCPRLAPGGGNGKGGDSNSLLPQAIFFTPPAPSSPMNVMVFRGRRTAPPCAAPTGSKPYRPGARGW